MSNDANAPEIPAHNEDIPLAEEIDNFEDPAEDPIHLELDRILLRMVEEEEENAPGIPPHNEDIPLIEELFNYSDSIGFPVFSDVDEEILREMESDQNMPENLDMNENIRQAFSPGVLFQEPEELDFVDMRQEAAFFEAVSVFAVATVENAPQVYEAEDVCQHDEAAAREPEMPVSPLVESLSLSEEEVPEEEMPEAEMPEEEMPEEEVPEEHLIRQNNNTTNKRKRKASENKKTNDKKKQKVATGDE